MSMVGRDGEFIIIVPKSILVDQDSKADTSDPR